MKKAVFIDRDGTMNEDTGYLGRVEDLRLYPSTAEAVRLLKNRDYLVIVVTNQSGVARGFYDIDALNAIHTRINEELEGRIDAFYFCPHLPGTGCVCRKPAPGMIEQAGKDFEIDMNGSWMIGDKNIDILTGKNVGINTALVKTGNGSLEVDKIVDMPEVIAEDLLEAVNQIISRAA